MIEVHVEQGLNLADRDLALGIATVLAPRQRWQVVFHGQANHAGTTIMAGRRDALVEAAAFVLAVDAAARARAGAVAHRGQAGGAPRIDQFDTRQGDMLLWTCARWTWRWWTRSWRSCARASATPSSAESRATTGRRSTRPARAAGRRRGRRAIPAGDLPSYAGHDSGILAPHSPRGDGVRAKSHRSQPHSRGNGRARGLRSRRAGAHRRARRRARRPHSSRPVDNSVSNS